jgi:lysine biosynthesis protein LysW
MTHLENPDSDFSFLEPSKKKENLSITKCPLCGEKIKIVSKPWLGQEVGCPACDAQLEVVSLRPLSLDWPYDDEGYYDIYDDDLEIEDYD